MSVAEIIFLVVLVACGIIGFFNGLRFGAPFVFAIIGSKYLSGFVIDILAGFMNTDGATLSIIAFAITFVVLLILLKKIMLIFENLVLLDAVGGAVFGAWKGLYLVNIAVFVMNSFGISPVDFDTRNAMSMYRFVENSIDLNIGYSRTSNNNYEIDYNYNYDSNVSASAPSIMPVKMSEIHGISSQFGQRVDPITHEVKHHGGIDFGGPVGTPIYATADGEVISVKISNKGYGNNVIIDHGNGYRTRYAHLNFIYVQIGDKVRKGQNIATMGSTGKSTGPHLHYEVIKDNKRINPMNFF